MLLTTVFDKVIANSCLDLMSAYGVTLVPGVGRSDIHIDTCNQAAIVGYSSRDIHGGSIALWMSDSLLEATCPSSDDQADWLSELLNQLTGRILNQLLAYDLHLVQSTPVVVRGKRLDLNFSGDNVRRFVFLTDNQLPVIEINVEFSFELDFNVQLKTSTSHSVSEGETIIF